MSSNYHGIGLYDSSSYNIIYENNIRDSNFSGITLINSNTNSFYGNNITNNYKGVEIVYSLNNTIYENNITNNEIGVDVEFSSNNNMHPNNFVDNMQQVSIIGHGYANLWDNEFEGNYWSSYTCVDLNHDGIGDMAHLLDENNTDRYPLMGMFHSFNIPLGYNLDVISNSTIESFEYFESNNTIRMLASNMTANQTFGFCRVRIPHALMNETYHVAVNGIEPYYSNYTIYDDGDNRWIYFSYQHSILEIIIVPEFPSFLILPIFMIATLLAVIVYKRKTKISDAM